MLNVQLSHTKKPLTFIFVILTFCFFKTVTLGLECQVALTDLSIYRGNDWKALPKQQQVEALWQETQRGLEKIRREVKFSDSLIDHLAAVVMSHDFAWLGGDPGGAKTFVSRSILDAELLSVSEEDKRIFLLQFDKLLTEGVITGFPKVKKMLESGIEEINTESSLVGDKYLFTMLDEIEKANPATLASLLSVLNERKAFLGDRIVDVLLLAGFSTSNKTVPEFLNSFEEDRPTGEALLDRFQHKAIVPNQTASADHDYELAKSWMDGSKKNDPAILGLSQLNPLIGKVEIPEDVLREASRLMTELDSQFTRLSDESRMQKRQGNDVSEYIPASQYSNRSVKGLIRLMKATFLVAQLKKGVAFKNIRFRLEKKDLVYLSAGAIYGGPGGLRQKRIAVIGPIRGKFNSAMPNVQLGVDPYDLRVYYRLPDDPFQEFSFALDPSTFDPQDQNVLASKAVRDEIIRVTKAADRKHIQYEDDGTLDVVKQMPGLTERSRQQFETVQIERTTFLAQLNALLSPANAPQAPAVKSSIPPRKRSDVNALSKRLEDLKTQSSPSATTLQEMAWITGQLFYEVANDYYRSADHTIRALFVSILGDAHLIIQGPAGGAKTSLANTVYRAELAGMNGAAANGQRELFFLQFNKLTPQGKIAGYPVIEKQIQEGVREFETKSSLVDRRFVFSVLDEVEKGSPNVQVKFLSILNERRAMHGSEELKAGLRSAAMTSNKTSAEWLQSFGDDKATGEAILARALNKVYVPNKFTYPEELADYLVASEKQNATAPAFPPLQLTTLAPLVDQVIIPDPVLRMAANIRREFLDKQSREAEDSAKKNREAPQDFPYVYEPASRGNNRSLKADMKQLKASFLVQQLVRGKSFDQIRWTMTPDDLILLSQGLTYWGPWVPLRTSQHGVVQYALGSDIDDLLSRSYIDARQKFVIGQVKREAQDFITILNQHYLRVALEIRDYVARDPQMGRGLIENIQEVQKWAAQQKP